MPRLRAPTLAGLLATCLLATAPPTPAAGSRDDLYDEYRATGIVQGCEHPVEELRAALADVPPDIRAYDPAFVDALDAALEQRAVACRGDVLRFPAAFAPSSGVRTAEDGSPAPRGPVRPAFVPGPRAEADRAIWPRVLLLAVLAASAGLWIALGGARGGRSPGGPDDEPDDRGAVRHSAG